MSRYVPPSKRKDLPAPALDSTALTNESLFPSLGTVVQKEIKGGFKEVIEERIRREAEDAIRVAAPIDLKAMSIEEREALGFTTLKVSGNTAEELAAVADRIHSFEGGVKETIGSYRYKIESFGR